MIFMEVLPIIYQNIQGFWVKVSFVSMNDTKNISNVLNDKTRLIWIETPTNPMMNIIDIKSVVDLVKGRDILVAVDNTFASSYIQQPLKMGVDIVMHSATKYLAGHSDVILGALIVNDNNLQNVLDLSKMLVVLFVDQWTVF